MCALDVARCQGMVKGVVVDERSGERLPFINVIYVDGKATKTNPDGSFTLPYKKGRLRVSGIGYETKTIAVSVPNDSLTVKLHALESDLGTAVVTGRKTKYTRKNNPAVMLMERVIAHKGENDLSRRDYYSIDKYTKIAFAFNEVTEKIFQEGKFKRLPFLKDHVEVCNETGKLILPISVDETVSREIYRKNPRDRKTIITGRQANGLNDLFQTGEIINVMLKDIFTDVDIYKESIRLFQHHFTSPIADHGAINFYRYFIVDTLDIGVGRRAIRVDFTPNNAQDYGFSGSLYITADSTCRVCKADLTLPKATMVNFVEDMRVIQEYVVLPTGEQVLGREDMLVQLKLVDFLQKFQVKRSAEYRHYDFSPIPSATFDFKGDTFTEKDAMMKDEKFWAEHRVDSLTRTEGGLKRFIDKLMSVKGFKPLLWVAKAFIENNVETSKDPRHPSKVDIGPINTMLTHNFVEGFRMRASAFTTANLHPQLFLKGYVAYGVKDKKVKGMGEVTYSFNKKEYLPREFPVNNLTFNYVRDVMSPSDKFLPTDKDNVFVSFKWKEVSHMMYYETYKLLWEREWENGLRYHLQVRTSKDRPTANLFYQPLGTNPPSGDPSVSFSHIRTYDLTTGLIYQPGVQWINTKQHRIASNSDAPIYQLTHTVGLYDFGRSSYNYNLTEAALYKRVWLDSWGKMNFTLKGGIAWNKVPFPLLIMPAANLSYIKEKDMFELIDNMEFLNDRYVSFMYNWDLNGKIFNRIPLFRRLKWREYIGCNVLWGMLTDKNNPQLARNADDHRLLYFPGKIEADGSYSPQSRAMNPRKPYVELMVGVHNVFKFFHVEYVQRLNYLRPGVHRWGVRLMFKTQF